MRTITPAVTLLLLALLTLWTSHTRAAELPPVTGASYDGQLISWTPQTDAIGYNLYRGSSYHDTVIGVNSYVPELSGRYSIAAFDGEGNYSAWRVLVDPDNVVQVDELAQGVDEPANVTGTVYSTTAGEVFWDRLFSRSLRYQVFLNGEPVGSTTGSSFFLNSLAPDAMNLVSVIAQSESGNQSGQIVLEFNTSAGPFPNDASLLDNLDQTLRPASPQNARITLYSTDTAELFWDRPPPSDTIVATDIFRDGEFLGTTDGISFYDDNGVFSFNQQVDSRHKYELVAINSIGERSLPAIINPGAFDGSTLNVVQRLLAGITEVTTNNAHVQWFPFLESLVFGEVSEFAEQVAVEPTVEDNILLSVRTEYSCFGGGSLTIIRAPSAITNASLSFNLCSIDGGEIDGQFALLGRDAGGYTATYENLGIDMIETSFGLDGVVDLSVGRGFGNTSLIYQNFSYDTFIDQFDDDDLFTDNSIFTRATMNQQVADTVTDQPRTLLTTNFTANGSWTNGRDIRVTTTQRFEDAVLNSSTGRANYVSGELLLESVNEEDSLVLSADTGEANSWSATITDHTIEGVVIKPAMGNWNENAQLPCVSAFVDDVDSSGCKYR
ncbi:MAG: hypothetical protein AB8B79_18815 [Granulosicoccus sp.]